MAIGYYQPLGNIPFYIFATAAILVLATYIWQFRESPGAKIQVYALLCKVTWLLSHVLIAYSQTFSGKIFWIYVGYLSGLLLPYCWYIFVLEISNQKNRITAIIEVGIMAIIGVEFLAAICNPWHIFCRDVFFDGSVVNLVAGPLVTINQISSYLICILPLGLSVRWIWQSSGLRRKQALLFTFAGLITLLGTIFLVFLPQVSWMHPLPLFSILSALIMTWGFYRWHVYDILPIAMDTVTKTMIDGFLIVDEDGYIIEINSVAKRVLAGLPVFIGGKFTDVINTWPALGNLSEVERFSIIEVIREYNNKTYYYQVEQILLLPKRNILGKILLFEDITQQKQDESKSMEQQRALAVLTERNRLSREIHDSQGQIPGYVKVQTQIIELFLQKGQLTEAVDQLEQLGEVADVALNEVRESITGLKLNSAEWNFYKTLQEWLKHFQRISGIAVIYNEPNYIPPSAMLPGSEVQLLRMIQEVLTNARKHSGASQVKVVLAFLDNWIQVTVTDNGCGFDVEDHSRLAKFGLTILQERAAEIGGTLKIRSGLAQGTMVSIGVPLVQSV
ncbi:MAG: liaS [Firmicutes bacterium]|nr:liaS [Bacillota bacterium]